MRTAPGLDSHDPIDRKSRAFGENFRVNFGEDVVGHGGQTVPITEPLT
jgi:hypothetical protein